MSERKVHSFGNLRPPAIRDHAETNQIVEQGLDPQVEERIRKAERGELKARLVEILDRGVVQDRLMVDLPEDKHGEWVRNDPLEVTRMQALGFTIDNEYAAKRAIHSDGSSSAIVGDVIHMICDKETKEVIDEIRLERMIRQHSPKRKGDREFHKEEEEFASSIENLGSPNIKGFTSSHSKSVDHKDISKIVEQIDNQTQKFE